MRGEFLIGGLGALALLVLSIMLGAVLLPICGLRLGTFGSLDFCPDPAPQGPSSALTAALERRAILEDRLRRLERRLSGLPACPSTREESAQQPEQDGLDSERWREQDIALLEGCWSLASDYQIQFRGTGVVTQVDSFRMCFDAEGRGEQQLAFVDGRECTGAVTASFADDERLRINDEANVQCTGGVYIFRRETNCTLEPNGEADCESYQPEIGGGTRNVRIMRRESP